MMHHYHDKQQLPYSARQLFDLVIDIERYPEFLPWCRAARILERGENRLRAELVVCFKHITESYVSEVTFRQPLTDTDDGFIDVNQTSGAFENLENHWKFTSLDKTSSEISLDLSFKFRSRLLDAIIGLLFGKASVKMVNAFKQRAAKLYGD
jgi:coenzyme Q-binding protein COQ10